MVKMTTRNCTGKPVSDLTMIHKELMLDTYHIKTDINNSISNFTVRPPSSSLRQSWGLRSRILTFTTFDDIISINVVIYFKRSMSYMELITMTRILGGERVLKRRIRNRMDLIELSHQGLTKEALLHLATYLSFSLRQMAALLPITERTLQRYTSEKHFNAPVSEQILQIAEIAAKGTEVFGDKEKFRLWMNQPSTALAGKPPLSLLSSRFGTLMVLDELGRIEQGVYI